MRVYHFINEEHGIDDIRRRRLKVATLNELNDPFELLGVGSTDSAVRRAFLETKTELSSSIGLLCFSRSWRNPVQWGHYADKHRGLCLGFDVPDKFLMQVDYRPTRLDWNANVFLDKGQAGRDAVQTILKTKYSHWRYEQEVRLFVRLSERDFETGLYFKSMSDDLALREVIVGHAAETSRADISKALAGIAWQVRVFKARAAFQSFRIVQQRKKELWL